jgi:hypothetical protein
MIEQFNKILQVFGSNRVRLVNVSAAAIEFEISGWAVFCLFHTGSVTEIIDNGFGRLCSHNYRAYWLKNMSQGNKRNDAGDLVG